MKSIRPFLLCLVGYSFVFISCTKDDEPETKTLNYLPLKTGNYWQLFDSPRTEVLGSTVKDGKTWFLVTRGTDTSLYRFENNRIFVIEDNLSSALMFDLSAGVNDSWNYHDWKITLSSKSDTIRLKDTVLTDCYEFFFDIPGYVDDEHSIWLAPGLGFVREQCGECVHPQRSLAEAKIDGHIFYFE
jgi:hypothetical protein